MTDRQLNNGNWLKGQIEKRNCELEFFKNYLKELKEEGGVIFIKESRDSDNCVNCDSKLSKQICELAISYLEAQKEKLITEFEAL